VSLSVTSIGASLPRWSIKVPAVTGVNAINCEEAAQGRD
jgi:hypothetical protein